MSRPKRFNVDQIIDDVMQAEYEWLESLGAEHVRLRQPRPGPQYFEEWDDWN
ncbi:hypothetical protein TPB0596_32040 [Tsukamurella pulmonis]|nr:hypothetical protein TPB0596_32040 [Tsukamurella pulmonis]